MGSLNDYAVIAKKEDKKAIEKKAMKGYAVMLLQLAVTMLLVLGAFFTLYAKNPALEAMSQFIQDNLAVESDWLYEEDALPVEAELPEFRLPCSGEIKKAYVRNADGGLDIAGFAVSGNAGEAVYPIRAGIVKSIGSDDRGLSLQIEHSETMYSIYAGLKTLSVKEGGKADTQSIMGTLGEGDLLFAVYINGEPVDPTALFEQIGN